MKNLRYTNGGIKYENNTLFDSYRNSINIIISNLNTIKHQKSIIEQAKKILEYAKEATKSINIVRAEHGNNEYDDNVYQRKVRAILNQGLSKIHSELNNEYTIHLILKKLDTEEFSDCLWAILYFILKKNPDMFEKVFKNTTYCKLKPSCSEFDVQLYSKKYKKTQIF